MAVKAVPPTAADPLVPEQLVIAELPSTTADEALPQVNTTQLEPVDAGAAPVKPVAVEPVPSVPTDPAALPAKPRAKPKKPEDLFAPKEDPHRAPARAGNMILDDFMPAAPPKRANP
jgi:hypothetical protein